MADGVGIEDEIKMPLDEYCFRTAGLKKADMIFISKNVLYPIKRDGKKPRKVHKAWAYCEPGKLVETEIARDEIPEIPIDVPVFSVRRKPYIPNGDFPTSFILNT